MAASLDDLKFALVNADKAGDTQAAQALAAEIERMSGAAEERGKPMAANAGLAEFAANALGFPTDIAQGALNLSDRAGRALRGNVNAALYGGDRFKNSVGTSAWIKQKLRETGEPGLSPDNPNPESGMGRLQYDLMARGGAIPGNFVPAASSIVAEKIGGPEWAGVGAMAGPALFNKLAGIVKPTPEAQALLKKKIVPTIGQAADEGTFMGRLLKSTEEKLQSVPVLGDVIKNARMRPKEEVNLQAIRTAHPGATDIGHKGIAQAEEYVSGLYERALEKFTGGIAPDQRFLKEAINASAKPELMLTKAQKSQVRNFVNEVVLTKFGAGVRSAMTPEMAKKIDSEIGAKVRNYKGSSVASERDLAGAFESLQKEFRALIDRNAPTPEVAAELADANRKYANFVRVRDAAASTGAKDGVFTPAQLQAAVRRGDYSTAKGAFSKGEALMQDLSAPAKSVLTDTVANSGTTDRALTAYMLAHPYRSALGLASGLVAAPLYTRTGQRFLLGDIPGQGIFKSQPYGQLGTSILTLPNRTAWMGSDAVQENR